MPKGRSQDGDGGGPPPSEMSRSLSELGDLSSFKIRRRGRWPLPAALDGHGGESGTGGRSASPSVPAASVPAPRRVTEGLTETQRAEILKLLQAGAGRAAACEHIGISMRSLCTEIVNDASFREEVETREEARINDCEMVIYESAMSGNLAAAVAFTKLKRDAKATDAALAHDRERLANEGRLTDAAVRRPLINVVNLDDAELARFSDLHDRVERQAPLSPEEAQTYVQLLGKVMASPRPAGPPPGPIPATPGRPAPADAYRAEVAEINRLFGIDAESA